MPKKSVLLLLMLILCSVAALAYAGEADVLYVYIDEDAGYYDISVTVKHADTGFEHYANWWRVRTEDGRELAKRELGHPHVDEQPFERALIDAVKLPSEVKIIIVEAHDLLHGYGGKTVRIDLSKPRGEGYEIK